MRKLPQIIWRHTFVKSCIYFFKGIFLISERIQKLFFGKLFLKKFVKI